MRTSFSDQARADEGRLDGDIADGVRRLMKKPLEMSTAEVRVESDTEGKLIIRIGCLSQQEARSRGKIDWLNPIAVDMT